MKGKKRVDKRREGMEGEKEEKEEIGQNESREGGRQVMKGKRYRIKEEEEEYLDVIRCN